MAIWLAQYILTVLAVFGVAFTLAFLDGPFGLCAKLRTKVIDRYKDQERKRWIVNGIKCPICQTAWLIWLPLLWVSWPPAMLAVASWWLWYVFGGLAAVGIVAKLTN